MLSKKEIKEILTNPNVLFAIQTKVCLSARVAIEELLTYMEELENKEQKLIEKLEKEVTADNIEVECGRIERWLYESRIKEIQKVGAKVTNEYRKEILKIAKGEK